MRTLVNDDGVLVSDLWIDQPSALQDLRGRASAANITDEQANAAADVITRGYGVIDLDLRPSIFEQIETEVEQIWAARPSDVAYGGSVDSVTGDFRIFRRSCQLLPIKSADLQVLLRAHAQQGSRRTLLQ